MPPFISPRRWVPLCVAVLGIGLPGCRSAATVPDVQMQAAQMANLSRAIEFQRVGDRIDAGGVTGAALPLADAVERSVRHDPAIQAAIARVHAALADARQARLLPNPVLSIAVRFPEGGGRTTIEAGLTAELVSLLSRPRRIDAADHRLAAVAAEALTTVLDALAEVQTTYAAVQALDAQVTSLQEQQRLVARMMDLARSRVEAGESPRLDLLILQTQSARLESERLELQTRRQEQRLTLARLVGVPSHDAQWTLEPWEPVDPIDVNAAAWIETALTHRPEVQARRWTLKALGADAALSRWSPFADSEAGVEVEREEEWSIGPAVASPLPLFDWGQARRDKAKAEQIEARHQLVLAQRRVVEEVRQALAALEGSQQALTHGREEMLPILEARHRQAADSYEAGLTGVTEVLLAEQDLQQGHSRLIDLQRDVTMNEVRLRRAVGGYPAIDHVDASTQPTHSEQS